MKFFEYRNLPQNLDEPTKQFCDLAENVHQTLPRNAERSAALRKLLEAKDCAVRLRSFEEDWNHPGMEVYDEL